MRRAHHRRTDTDQQAGRMAREFRDIGAEVMDEKLKPCPFCTSTVLMTLPPTCTAKSPYNPADRLYPVVRCQRCCAEATGENGDHTTRTAIERWNRRPGEDTARASGYAAGIADAAEVAEKWERQPVGIRSFRDPDDDGWLDIELIFEEGRAEHLIAAAIRALSTSKGDPA